MIKKILLIVISVVVLAALCLFIFVQVTWDKKYDWAGPAMSHQSVRLFAGTLMQSKA